MPVKSSSEKSWTRLVSIGFELAAAIGGFTLVGYWWDRHFGSTPWGVLTGALLGLVGGMYNLVRQSLLATRNAGGETKKTNGDGER
ncbi:MAG TPA: AtpZ/AtpI family protein [Thermoanaerobaculia bacterium]|nr:AtpZ/AtpI family protein [Thermoanaerobaculia bacterium]